MPHAAASSIRALIHRQGPIPFDEFMELALYGPDGFFTRGRGAGRAGRDFLTSPQVGPLFGVLVGRALDREWEALGQPDPFFVIEVGAGDGRLAREVERAAPRCATALRYLLIERSSTLRAEQRERLTLVDASQCLGPYRRGAAADEDDPLETVAGSGPRFAQLDALPARKVEGVVLANELFDNLSFGIAERGPHGWLEVRIGLGDGAGERQGATQSATDAPFVEVAVPIDDVECFGVDVPVGARVPMPRALDGWFTEIAAALHHTRGRIIAVDYVAPFAEVVARSPHWLRTYADHERGHDPLTAVGERDITADVPVEHVVRAAARAGFMAASIDTQADWLRALGLDELVAEGDRLWSERAHVGDLAALAARSRRNEAAALTDLEGLGGFRVLRLVRAEP